MASERKFVSENIRRVLLKEYLMKEVSRAGFGGLQVQRRPNGTHIELTVERPGLVIGPRGQTIKAITSSIKNEFSFENPQIEVVEVENPNLNAQIMAEKLAFSLERGWHFRRAGHSSVRRIMESGARGCHIILAGKLTGQRHRTEKFKDGHIKFCGEPSDKYITRGFAVAKLKMGVIGVTVEIMDRDSRLPTDIDVVSKTEASELYPDIFAPKEEKVEVVTEAEVEEPVVEDVIETPEETVKEEPVKEETVKEEPVKEEPVAEIETPEETVKDEPVEAAEPETTEEEAQ